MRFKRLHPAAQLPKRQSEGAAGYDLHSTGDPDFLPSGIDLYPTGVAVKIPSGHVGLIFDRSGVATKKAFTRVAGVIDSDYTGELKVALASVGNGASRLMAGDRIAQLVVVPCVMEDSEWVLDLDDTARGAGGFGSTGK